LRQRRNNCFVRQSFKKFGHPREARVAEAAAIVLGQSLRQLLENARAVSRPLALQDLGFDRFADVPVGEHQGLVHLGKHLRARTVHQLLDALVQRIHRLSVGLGYRLAHAITLLAFFCRLLADSGTT